MELGPAHGGVQIGLGQHQLDRRSKHGDDRNKSYDEGFELAHAALLKGEDQKDFEAP